MKIAVYVTKSDKQTIDVTFPLYFKLDLSIGDDGWADYYSRIDGVAGDADGWMYEVSNNERGEWTYKKALVHLPWELGSRLSKSDDKDNYKVITANEFYAKVAEMQKALADIPPADAGG